MNVNEAGRVLLMAISLDPKMPQPDEAGFIRGVWAAALHDIPIEAAQNAVLAYYRSDGYAQSRETIAPADIVQWWNNRRRPTERERLGVPVSSQRALPAPPADPDRIMAGVSMVRASLSIKKGIDPDIAQGEADAAQRLRSKRCTHCGAAERQPCTTVRGEPLTKTLVHDARERAAMGQDMPTTPRSATIARREIDSMDPAG